VQCEETVEGDGGTAVTIPAGRAWLNQLQNVQRPGSELVSLASIGPTKEAPVSETSVLCQIMDANIVVPTSVPPGTENLDSQTLIELPLRLGKEVHALSGELVKHTQVYGLATAVVKDPGAPASIVSRIGFLLTVGLIFFLTHFYEACELAVHYVMVTLSLKVLSESVVNPDDRKVGFQPRCPLAVLAPVFKASAGFSPKMQKFRR
jgi:hypothetical protein